jgi:hypothetical protein
MIEVALEADTQLLQGRQNRSGIAEIFVEV